MADRKGKLCDDCLARGKEEIIGTCSCLMMYMVIGTYEQGPIAHEARLPRFGWGIYAEYDERGDVLEMRPVPRAELCACCWVERLTAVIVTPDGDQQSALDLLTHDQYFVERKMLWEAEHPEIMEARVAEAVAAEAVASLELAAAKATDAEKGSPEE